MCVCVCVCNTFIPSGLAIDRQCACALSTPDSGGSTRRPREARASVDMSLATPVAPPC